jgi:hypothetical protein
MTGPTRRRTARTPVLAMTGAAAGATVAGAVAMVAVVAIDGPVHHTDARR